MVSRVELFALIRRDARVEELSVRALAERHGVHRRTVRQALGSAVPPPRKTPARHAAVSLPRCGQTRSSADRSWTGTSMRGVPGVAIRGVSVGCGSSAVSPSAATIAARSSGSG